jgi:Flp pilus assembly protein TadG
VRSERGSTTVLIIGFFLVLGLAVGLVVDASAAYLRRQALANLADAAALAAADGVKATHVYAGRVDGDAPIDLDVAKRYALEFLRTSGASGRYDGLRLVVGSSGGAVTVRVSAPLELPIAPPDWEDTPVITAESAALVVVGP